MYRIVIPSANRTNSKYFKTISLLRKIGINMKDVYLFLDTTQSNLYQTNYSLQDINIVECQNKNIVQIRNYIERDYFPNNTHLVCLDDDLNYLSYKDKDNNIKKVIDLHTFNNLIINAFNLCLRHKCLLWGVYPIARNEKWFSETKTFIGNNHIVAACSGVIVNKNLKRQNQQFLCKEEYEREFMGKISVD